jgi:hypothetical protein
MRFSTDRMKNANLCLRNVLMEHCLYVPLAVRVTQNDQPEPSVASGRALPLCCLSLPHRKFCAISSTPPEAAVFERKHGFFSRFVSSSYRCKLHSWNRCGMELIREKCAWHRIKTRKANIKPRYDCNVTPCSLVKLCRRLGGVRWNEFCDEVSPILIIEIISFEISVHF